MVSNTKDTGKCLGSLRYYIACALALISVCPGFAHNLLFTCEKNNGIYLLKNSLINTSNVPSHVDMVTRTTICTRHAVQCAVMVYIPPRHNCVDCQLILNTQSPLKPVYIVGRPF